MKSQRATEESGIAGLLKKRIEARLLEEMADKRREKDALQRLSFNVLGEATEVELLDQCECGADATHRQLLQALNGVRQQGKNVHQLLLVARTVAYADEVFRLSQEELKFKSKVLDEAAFIIQRAQDTPAVAPILHRYWAGVADVNKVRELPRLLMTFKVVLDATVATMQDVNRSSYPIGVIEWQKAMAPAGPNWPLLSDLVRHFGHSRSADSLKNECSRSRRQIEKRLTSDS